MSEYLSTFISLFGSISAIAIAFLVLLYDSAKNKLNNSRINYTSEIESFFNCKNTHDLKLLDGDENTYLKLKLLSDYKYGRVNEDKTKQIIDILTSKIDDINTSQQDKEHLQKFHLNDILSEQKNYNQNKEYFTKKFPIYAKSVIAIPFLITVGFTLIAKYNCYLLCKLTPPVFDGSVVTIVILGLLFIYYTCIKAIQDLNKINL